MRDCISHWEHRLSRDEHCLREHMLKDKNSGSKSRQVKAKGWEEFAVIPWHLTTVTTVVWTKTWDTSALKRFRTRSLAKTLQMSTLKEYSMSALATTMTKNAKLCLKKRKQSKKINAATEIFPPRCLTWLEWQRTQNFVYEGGKTEREAHRHEVGLWLEAMELDTCTNIFDSKDWWTSEIRIWCTVGCLTRELKSIQKEVFGPRLQEQACEMIAIGMVLPFPQWSWKACKIRGLGLLSVWMVTRNSWFSRCWFVSRVQWEIPSGDLSSFARMIAFSAAPAGAGIYWVLLRTVASYDLKCDTFNANTTIKFHKDFL